ncbi:MAG: polysaccharide biosynthesis C-terminal domain-containing protein, partial [Halobacteriaceae archaeon]
VAVGLYNGAYPFARLLNTGNVMFSSIFLSNASKMVSAGDTEQLASLFRTVVKWVAIVTLPVFVILIAFPRSVLLFFGEKYYSMAPVLRILAAGFFISSLTGPVSRIYEAFERTKLSMIFSGVLAFSNLLLNYILISTFPSRAPLAAAVATSTAFFVNFVLDVVFMKKMLGRQPFRSSVIRVVGAALTAILVVYLLSNLLFAATPVWFLVIDLLIFSAVYATIVGFGGVLEEDDRVVVEAVLRKLGLSEEHASLLRYA